MKRVLTAGLGLAMVIMMAGTSLAETLTLQSDTSVEYFDGTNWLPAVETQVHTWWVLIPDVKWIWLCNNWTYPPITLTLRKQFSIPVNADKITGNLVIAADNTVSVYLNNVLIGDHDSYSSTKQFVLSGFIIGENELKFVVTNGIAEINPAGVTFKADIDYESTACYTKDQLDRAVKTEQLKWDANGDGRIGLEDIIRMLQVIAGLRP